jgi:quercetin dioxygenase-like cupin family protein
MFSWRSFLNHPPTNVQRFVWLRQNCLAASQIASCLICIKARLRFVVETPNMSEQPLLSLDREKIISLAAETQFAPNGIVSRTLLRGPNGRVVLFGFAEGQELTEHTSTQQALIQLLSGECEFFLAGEPHVMKAGDLLYMPPNLPHAVKATKQFSMLLTLMKPA